MAVDDSSDESGSDEVNDSSKKSSELKKEEKKLKQEIAELKAIITQAELSLNTVKFGNIKNVRKSSSSITGSLMTKTKISNTTAKLHTELYRSSGFYCSKFSKREYIFNFSCLHKDKKEEFAIQIFNKDEEGSIGKWVLPMSINMDELVSEIPVKNLKNITPFLKRCKHLIDCYSIRRDQFEGLKKSTEEVKNLHIDTNMGYTQINLEFFGFHNLDDDKYINIIVYLLYAPNEIRPKKMKIDSNEKTEISHGTIQELKQLLKPFKSSDLQKAFEEIQTNQDSFFSWSQADEESPLELNATSSSEEDYLTNLKQKRKKARRKKKQLSQLHKKWQDRQKVASRCVLRKVDQSDNENNGQSSENTSPAKRVSFSELKKKKGFYMSISPQSNTQKHLKQTKLKFKPKHHSQNDKKSNPEELEESSSSNPPLVRKNKALNLLTSTPLTQNHKRLKKEFFANLEITDIIDDKNETEKITAPKKKETPKKKATLKKAVTRNKHNLNRNKEPLRALQNKSIVRKRIRTREKSKN